MTLPATSCTTSQPSEATSRPGSPSRHTSSSRRSGCTRCSRCRSRTTSRWPGSTATNGWWFAPQRRCRSTPAACWPRWSAREIKDVRVIKPRIGGGFGAKQEMLIEDIVSHLAILTRRPVKLELSREEEFMSSRTQASPDTHVQDRCRCRRQPGGPETAARRQHRAVRDPRLHRADRHRSPRAHLLQLPQQGIRLRRRLHQHSGARRVPRVRRSSGRVRPRSPHGGHRPCARAGPHRVQAAELGEGRRRAQHRPPPRRDLGHRRRARRVPHGHVKRHRGVRRSGQAGHRLAPP